MNQAINNIKKLPHVSGVCVYDTKHQLVVNSAPAIFSTKDLANIGELLTDITFQARNKLPLITDLLLQYEGVSLIVRNTSDRTMLVLGSPEMNERMV
ncbi:MAG: hypothetical protein U9R29_10300, partial [Thermodesulfobacteriota bacterium]|nr:hypothetical protein [Thermodesulfobacteriota bacterium]